MDVKKSIENICSIYKNLKLNIKILNLSNINLIIDHVFTSFYNKLCFTNISIFTIIIY